MAEYFNAQTIFSYLSVIYLMALVKTKGNSRKQHTKKGNFIDTFDFLTLTHKWQTALLFIHSFFFFLVSALNKYQGEYDDD